MYHLSLPRVVPVVSRGGTRGLKIHFFSYIFFISHDNDDLCFNKYKQDGSNFTIILWDDSF